MASSGAGGTVFILSTGLYVIDYELSLANAGSVALYTGPSSGTLEMDKNTVSGSSHATTWIHGRAIKNVVDTLVVAVSSVVGIASVVNVANGLHMIRLTILKIA